uniref:thioredoxin-dependent peroxiredoxin n=1 Tax=Oryctolagus cuniculus TaxID=9986 RepID=A0A5F9DD95_RABIT
MEAPLQLLPEKTPSPGWSPKLLLLFLLLAVALRGLEAEERPRTREEECHFYAGGQVYPGEASRVSVADHSLHLSKAKISKPAPYWEGTAVINGEFKELKLTDYRGKYLVFFFYPLDFTFVCPTEIIAFGDRIEEFRSINTEVVACSVDSQFTHLAWINTPRRQGGLGPIKIPLLSDLTHQISKDYGVYLEDSGHTLRGLFIIDDKGVLRQITLNDLPVGRSVDETLRLVQAFQYTDKHGEVCPAGWKPGSETVSYIDFSVNGMTGSKKKKNTTTTTLG